MIFEGAGILEFVVTVRRIAIVLAFIAFFLASSFVWWTYRRTELPMLGEDVPLEASETSEPESSAAGEPSDIPTRDLRWIELVDWAGDTSEPAGATESGLPGPVELSPADASAPAN